MAQVRCDRKFTKSSNIGLQASYSYVCKQVNGRQTVKALRESEVRALLATPAQSQVKLAFIASDEGLTSVPMSSVKASALGKFEGKQGTSKRSRKGVVRIQPNGWRKYNDTDATVVAYQL